LCRAAGSPPAAPTQPRRRAWTPACVCAEVRVVTTGVVCEYTERLALANVRANVCVFQVPQKPRGENSATPAHEGTSKEGTGRRGRGSSDDSLLQDRQCAVPGWPRAGGGASNMHRTPRARCPRGAARSRPLAHTRQPSQQCRPRSATHGCDRRERCEAHAAVRAPRSSRACRARSRARCARGLLLRAHAGRLSCQQRSP
jgi:hypothetical protein